MYDFLTCVEFRRALESKMLKVYREEDRKQIVTTLWDSDCRLAVVVRKKPLGYSVESFYFVGDEVEFCSDMADGTADDALRMLGMRMGGRLW